MVALVSLDIEGAFDNAWWPAVLRELLNMGVNAQTMRVLSSYFRDRTVVVRYLGQKVLKKTTKGCVQGSIGGPLLRNVQLDPSLGVFPSYSMFHFLMNPILSPVDCGESLFN